MTLIQLASWLTVLLYALVLAPSVIARGSSGPVCALSNVTASVRLYKSHLSPVNLLLSLFLFLFLFLL
jgi:hypothetical protein